MNNPLAEQDALGPFGEGPSRALQRLELLRACLIRALLGMVPAVAIAWSVRESLLEILAAPLVKAWHDLQWGTPTLHFRNPIDPFTVYLKIAMIGGTLLASPWIAYQAWQLLGPELAARTKRHAIPFALSSAVFFVGGVVFGYVAVLPLGFESLLGMAGLLPSQTTGVQPTIMLDEYLGFMTAMLLGFGIVFEVPVVLTFLALARIVSWKQLARLGRHWILISSILAAGMTPSPDVGSMMMMMIPLVVLYYVSVLVAYIVWPNPGDEPTAPDPS